MTRAVQYIPGKVLLVPCRKAAILLSLFEIKREYPVVVFAILTLHPFDEPSFSME